MLILKSLNVSSIAMRYISFLQILPTTWYFMIWKLQVRVGWNEPLDISAPCVIPSVKLLPLASIILLHCILKDLQH